MKTCMMLEAFVYAFESGISDILTPGNDWGNDFLTTILTHRS